MPRTVVPPPEYTVLYANTDALPDTTSNQSWSAEISFTDNCMTGVIEENAWGALSLKYEGELFENGSLRFDIKSNGTLVNISIFEADTDRMIPLGQVKATTEYKTYIYDIDCPDFIRFNFQDTSGEGVEFRLQNIFYSSGTRDDF
ncbi:galactose-binding like protein, partial [Piromyces finnis]